MTPQPIDRYIEFREPRTVTELEQMLKLRYEVRRSCKLAALCPENDAQIDLDQFDRYAYHVGLFMLEDHRFVSVGYSRFVVDQLSPRNNWVSMIGQKYGMEAKLADPIVPFPCVAHMPEKYGKLILEMHLRARSNGQVMGENSGLVLRPDIRSIRIAARWIDAIVAYCKIYKGIQHGVTNVTPRHAPFYYQYGFRLASGIPNPWGTFQGVPGSFICLEYLPDSGIVIDRVTRAAAELFAGGKVVISTGLPRRITISQPIISERTEICSRV